MQYAVFPAAIGLLLTGHSFADSIVVDGKTYNDVLVREAGVVCLVQDPGDGSAITLRKRDVSPMIDLPYSLNNEATGQPDSFGFSSTELDGFSGVGHSSDVCVYKTRLPSP